MSFAVEGERVFATDTTVFELAGQDKAGLLADITDLLSANDCTVRSAAVSLPCFCDYKEQQHKHVSFKQLLTQFHSYKPDIFLDIVVQINMIMIDESTISGSCLSKDSKLCSIKDFTLGCQSHLSPLYNVQCWTQEGRVAFVLSVTEKNLPVSPEKLGGFHKMLMRIMDANGEGIVRTWTVCFQSPLLSLSIIAATPYACMLLPAPQTMLT